MATPIFGCDYKCEPRFTGTFEEVSKHELTCCNNPNRAFGCDYKCEPRFTGTFEEVAKHELTCCNNPNRAKPTSKSSAAESPVHWSGGTAVGVRPATLKTLLGGQAHAVADASSSSTPSGQDKTLSREATKKKRKRESGSARRAERNAKQRCDAETGEAGDDGGQKASNGDGAGKKRMRPQERQSDDPWVDPSLLERWEHLSQRKKSKIAEIVKQRTLEAADDYVGARLGDRVVMLSRGNHMMTATQAFIVGCNRTQWTLDNGKMIQRSQLVNKLGDAWEVRRNAAEAEAAKVAIAADKEKKRAQQQAKRQRRAERKKAEKAKAQQEHAKQIAEAVAHSRVDTHKAAASPSTAGRKELVVSALKAMAYPKHPDGKYVHTMQEIHALMRRAQMVWTRMGPVTADGGMLHSHGVPVDEALIREYLGEDRSSWCKAGNPPNTRPARAARRERKREREKQQPEAASTTAAISISSTKSKARRRRERKKRTTAQMAQRFGKKKDGESKKETKKPRSAESRWKSQQRTAKKYGLPIQPFVTG